MKKKNLMSLFLALLIVFSSCLMIFSQKSAAEELLPTESQIFDEKVTVDKVQTVPADDDRDSDADQIIREGTSDDSPEKMMPVDAPSDALIPETQNPGDEVTEKNSGIRSGVEPIYVYFEDPNLARAIRAKLNLPEDARITQGDLNSIGILDANGYGIRSLKGLEFAENLVHLYLDDNFIEDLTPLKWVWRLQILSFKNNQVKDLSPLENLPALRHLTISDNPIYAMNPLFNVKTLEKLYADGISRTLFTPVSVWPKLYTITLNNNEITNFQSLKGNQDQVQ